ncbi:DUF5694 domain-containing protein [Microbulbifer variabilis]|uniref:DUF5694 domain-containing protein n=1 Tax=Microbulbifer variabilis TaxID=266805 RepID=UPI001CFD79F8|nr:DUF5694 domain-containing protein [Microbulbifer variabilis]
MKKTIKIFSILLTTTICHTIWAQETAEGTIVTKEPAKVMMFGIFHFKNPGLDLIKSDQINVLTNESQSYLEKLANKLGKQKPTHVLAECDPKEQDNINKNYKNYIDGLHELNSNETEQIGFRVAKTAGLTGIICYDDIQIHNRQWTTRAYMEDADPERYKEYSEFLKEFKRRTDEEHKSLSLRELLKLTNNIEHDKQNMNLSIRNNDVKAENIYLGAEGNASWWHRNFRMYANIQRVAQPGTRVIIIGGQGHTAIMKILLASDLQRKAWDINVYL